MALAADRNTPMKDAELIAVPVAANAVIHAGGLTVANATGYAAPGSTATTLTYLGRAEEAVDNTGGAAGAKTVNVRRGKAFKFKNSGADAVTQAEVGQDLLHRGRRDGGQDQWHQHPFRCRHRGRCRV